MGENFVLHGPEIWGSVPEVSLGKQLYESFLASTDKDIAFVEFKTGKELSYQKFFDVARRLAVSLINCGYGRSDVISISSENHSYFFAPVVAALYLGIPIAPLNHTYSEGELTHALKISKPKVVFCSKAIANNFVKLKKILPFIERIVLVEPDVSHSNCENIEDFISKNCRSDFDVENFKPVDLNPFESTAVILCSSGTTGLPKGVMLTHDNISMRINQVMDPRLNRPSYDVVLGILPFFHSYGFVTNVEALITRNTTIVVPRFEEEAFLSVIEKYKISQLFLVPPLMVFLAKTPLLDKYDMSSVVELVSGAAPLSPKIEMEVRKRFPHVKTLRQGYGLTEATLAVFIMPLGQYKTGSSGKIVPGMSCFVRDLETGKPLGPKQVGELCFKGRLVMKGYYQNPEATRNTITSDGWLLTGDLGYYDEDKHFFIVDRLKELIKYKGFQVPPAELEALLLAHAKIKDAAVIGVPDDLAGELATAFVVVEPGEILTEDEVKNFVAGQVSKAKHLHGGVKFVTEIPKNPSGKILRRKLREMVQKQKSKL